MLQELNLRVYHHGLFKITTKKSENHPATHAAAALSMFAILSTSNEHLSRTPIEHWNFMMTMQSGMNNNYENNYNNWLTNSYY
jgi:hypothetical protein